MNKFKAYAKEFIPPIALTILKNLNREKYGFFTSCKSWEDARNKSAGYDTPEILERVKEVMLKVKSGEAFYERDSVLFDTIQYSWPLLACLQRVASCYDNCLGVLDIGGSLGSSYYQNKEFLSTLRKLRWCIVEQPSFVDVGRTYFENHELTFYHDVSECKEHEDINLILLSGVLQFFENPHDTLRDTLNIGFDNIIVDRTNLLLNGNRDLLTVQTVPPSIYTASYPHWFFERSRFLKDFSDKDYHIVAEWEGFDTTNIRNSINCGFLFSKPR